MRGNANASPGGIVVPSMVRANQTAILNTPSGKPRATMEAKIFPHAQAVVAPPEHKVLAKKACRPHFLCFHVRRLGNNMPII